VHGSIDDGDHRELLKAAHIVRRLTSKVKEAP
jgi:hypothetical protein